MQTCFALGFNETSFPNFIGETSQANAIEAFDAYFKEEIELCNATVREEALFFVCSLQFPKCQDNAKKKPCKRLCNGMFISHISEKF